MRYNFDEVINRENTSSYKYDRRMDVFDNPDVLPLWVADMDFKTPPFVIDAIRQRLDHEILGYTDISESFYQAVIDWNKRHYNWDIKSGWISFSPGVVPAINLLVMTFTQPGDSIIIQPPVYFPFFEAIKNHNRNLVTNPLLYQAGNYSIDIDDLEAKIDRKTRMLFLCSPHNPTGNVWSAEILKRIGELCAKNNILLVSDEIHADLVYSGFRHIPTASLNEEIASFTITCMSASKTFNLAGLSTSYLVISNRNLRHQYESMLDRVHVGAGNIFGFIATEAAYNLGDEWLRQLMEYLTGNLSFLNDFIFRHIPMVKVVQPQATYLVWLDFRSLDLAPDVLKKFIIEEAGLGLNDGLQFGIEGKGFQRINIACPRSLLYEALTKLKVAIDKYYTK
jgi:cystathionine beta-lyase